MKFEIGRYYSVEGFPAATYRLLEIRGNSAIVERTSRTSEMQPRYTVPKGSLKM